MNFCRARKYFLILLCFLFSLRSISQSYDEQRGRVFAINLLSNALMSGVGGAINKSKEEKLHRAFLRNFLKGGVGGLLKYSAKYQTYYLGNSNQVYFTPVNRLYYFLGHSIVMNAAYDRKMLATYYCNFYGIDLRYTFKAENKLLARLSLATLGTAVYFGIKGYELNLYRTLERGLLFFDVYHNGLPGTGQAGFNCIAVEPPLGNSTNYNVFPHELVHTYQMYDYFSLASLYNKPFHNKLREKKLYNTLAKYLVADYMVLFYSAFYLAQPPGNYHRNYFEFEAQHFRSRAFVSR